MLCDLVYYKGMKKGHLFLIRGEFSSVIISLIVFCSIVIGGLWYLSYASKTNIDRILEKRDAQQLEFSAERVGR